MLLVNMEQHTQLDISSFPPFAIGSTWSMVGKSSQYANALRPSFHFCDKEIPLEDNARLREGTAETPAEDLYIGQ